MIPHHTSDFPWKFSGSWFLFPGRSRSEVRQYCGHRDTGASGGPVWCWEIYPTQIILWLTYKYGNHNQDPLRSRVANDKMKKLRMCHELLCISVRAQFYLSRENCHFVSHFQMGSSRWQIQFKLLDILTPALALSSLRCLRSGSNVRAGESRGREPGSRLIILSQCLFSNHARSLSLDRLGGCQNNNLWQCSAGQKLFSLAWKMQNSKLILPKTYLFTFSSLEFSSSVGTSWIFHCK